MKAEQDQRLKANPNATPQSFLALALPRPLTLKTTPGSLTAKPTKPIEAATVLLLAWNHTALDLTSIDHTTPGNGADPATYGEQWGPPRTARAMAIVHLAMAEAANFIDWKYKSYSPPGPGPNVRDKVIGSLDACKPSMPQVTCQGFVQSPASIAAAISAAANTALSALYPRKQGLIDAARTGYDVLVAASESAQPSASDRIRQGKLIGQAVAIAVLSMRSSDGSIDYSTPNICATKNPLVCTEPDWDKTIAQDPPAPDKLGLWSRDPVSQAASQVGGNWHNVRPFVVDPAPLLHYGSAGGGTMTLASGTYAAPDYTHPNFIDELNAGDPAGGTIEVHVKLPIGRNPAENQRIAQLIGTSIGTLPLRNENVRYVGGAGPDEVAANQPANRVRLTATTRTKLETVYGEFWGYDGVALLCAPPRLYNMIATTFLLEHSDAAQVATPVAAARYLALVNVAMADAGLAAWAGKYGFDIARPVTVFRYGAKGAPTPVDPQWTPLGLAATNGPSFNITPPFPSYPSGHAVFGAAVFSAIAATLNLNMDTSSSAFDFVSDEFNGENVGADGSIRPYMKVSFKNLRGAEWENAESRIWLGIHWQVDAYHGIKLGEEVAQQVVAAALLPCSSALPPGQTRMIC